MCDQTEISYLDGEVVWVKLGNCWWPGEVVTPDELSPDILRSYRKPPLAIVKFFQEDAYEFVKNINSIYKYQCSRKHEFINKGLSLYRTKHGHMEKFPEDVIRAETKVGGDVEILTRDEFQKTKKESYAGLFGTPAKKPNIFKKGRGRLSSESPKISTPVRRMKEKTDYKVHILLQGSKTASTASPATSAELPTPSTSTAECPATQEPTSTDPKSDDKPDTVEKPVPTNHTPTAPSTPSSGSGIYACHACSFTTTRLNVLILHNKSHSVSYVPYTPSPIKKKPVNKSSTKSTPNTSKPPKQRKPRQEKKDKAVKINNKKRSLEDKVSEVESKKLKTDEEIKSSLLADWDDDVDDESNDDSATAATQSPEVPLGAHSPEAPLGAGAPAEPSPPAADLSAAQVSDLSAAQVSADLSPVPATKTHPAQHTDKPEASSDSNKYEFCEDEDWPVEADAGRKIPRVKNPVRTEEAKSISIDEDDMAREVAELLNKTAVPELPSVPEPLKIEENFPEPSVVKSPDKKKEYPSGPTLVPEGPPTKVIFKTKTFFRSRHSRSQDAIGKYVAEQLNNVEKMDIADSDLNGSDNVSSPEARDSPPIEHIKVARLAPKIQLKRMKAEAQLREKERNRFEPSVDPYSLLSDIMGHNEKTESPHEDVKGKQDEATVLVSKSSQNVLYPPEEIIPLSEIDPPNQKMNEVPDINYDASTEGEDTCESLQTIEENHQVTEESESSQETHEIDIDHAEIEKTESNQKIIDEDVQDSESNDEIVGEVVPDSDSNQEFVEVVPDPDSNQKNIEVVPNPESNQELVEEVVQDSNSNQEIVEVVQESDSNQEIVEVIPDSDLNQEIVKEVHESEIMYQENRDKSIEVPGIRVPEQMLSDTPEPTDSFFEEEKSEHPVEHYMNESTASAVDALLSVSREADRVTRTISDDPPEDLFEDDNKDGSIDSNTNGDINDTIETIEEPNQILFNENEQDVVISEVMEKEQEVMPRERKKEPDQSMSSANDEPLTIPEEDNKSQENCDQIPTYLNLIHETVENKLSVNKEQMPTTNDEPVESVLPANLHKISALNDELVTNVYETLTEKPAVQEESDKNMYPVNVKIPAFQENSNGNVLFNKEEILTLHKKTEDNVFVENELHIPETHEESEHVMIHSGFSETEEEIITTQESEIVSEESVYLQNEDEITIVQDETEIPIDDNPDEYITSSEIYQNEEVVTTPHIIESHNNQVETIESTIEKVPSESDLQIAEALINLPATALQSKTPTEPENHVINFELDSVQEEIIHASEYTVSSKKATKRTNEIEELSLSPNDESVNVRFETEQEKCENLNAAQSLLHMSESIEHTISIPESMDTNDITKPVISLKQNNGIPNSIEQNMAKISAEIINEPEKVKKPFITSSSKLLQILEEPSTPRFTTTKVTPAKPIVMRGKEKILNFDVAKSSFKSKPHSPNQKIIIRRTTPSKSVLNNISEMPSHDKIILSRSNPSHEGSVQRFTIQTAQDAPSDANTIIIQQKIRKLSKPPTKIQKIKQQTSLVAVSEAKPAAETSVDNAMFDINSMPIVLSEDLITAESIEKMQVVMSDSNVNPVITQLQQPPKHTRPKINITENEKITVTSMPKKQEVKTTMLINSVSEVQNKTATPNILSKSAKLRAAKPMLVIDKTTGKQKIIMTKAESTIKEVKKIQKTPTLLQKTSTLVQKTPTLLQKAPTLVQKTQTLLQKAPTLVQKTLVQTTPTLMQTTPTLMQTTQTLIQPAPTLIQAASQSTKQSSQAEKFIILPTQNVTRPGRTQKIVIDPQTGKAHMILSRGKETSPSIAENKPVSAKLVPSKSETNSSGNTVMIITNAQGAQSRIVLTPEHERILFPNKQQQKGSQLKTIAHRITTASALPQIKTGQSLPTMRQIVATTKTPTRIVPKQKNAIITSKGQLIVGGRVATATTAQNIAPMPEIRQVPKRLSQTEPRKLVQAIQKTNSEPIIYLQQKSGAVMQLTASQFEQLQRTGQIVQKTPAQPAQERVIIQKTRTLVEASSSQKPRARKMAMQGPTPAKKSKHQHEIAIAPAPPTARYSPLLPALTAIAGPSTAPAPAPAPAPASPSPPAAFSIAPVVSSAIASSSAFSEFDNFEEMLPSTAIARQPEPQAPVPAPAPAPAPVPEPAPVSEPAPEPAAAALADGQLLAVPGEHFGGPVGSFYLCVEEQGTYTPIDNRPLVLENNQLVPMSEVAVQPERRDILSAALANSDVFHADAGDVGDAPDFRDLNANVSVHCRVSETSTTLHQPIMTPQELPSCGAVEPAAPASLEDGLAVIGVTPHAVPTSLELPITVTDPRIATRALPPLAGGGGYGTTLMPSPAAELCYVSAEESCGGGGGGSMPLLTEEEEEAPGEASASGGMSMPILTDEVNERTVSSVESALGSPASLATDAEDASGHAWTRRLLTPGSDTSDLSVEIPLQPSIQLTVGHFSEHT